MAQISETIEWLSARIRTAIGPDVRTASVNGHEAKFRVDTVREFFRTRDLAGETDLIRRILAAAEPTDVFWDVGANIGTHTCLVGAAVKETHSFEPHPPTADRLSENVALNGVDATVHRFALSDSNGTVELGLSDASWEELGSGEYTTKTDSGVDVDTHTADWIVDSGAAPAPDLVKIDVEGGEGEVLAGASEAFAGCHDLFIEVHREHVTPDDVRTTLEGMGFSISTIGDRRGETHLHATRR